MLGNMQKYQILPFTFKSICKDKILLVNQVGEFIVLNFNDFQRFKSIGLNCNEELYSDLKAKHLLADTNDGLDLAVDLLATKLRTRKAFLVNFTALHMMVVTLRCNCRCTYCHASSVDIHKKNFDMTWNIAKNTIDIIFQTPAPAIKIEFQGGEPLLNWDIIKESVLYAEFLNKFINKQVDFIICTNLINIDKDKLDFCKKHHILISTSLDGYRQHHDLHRKTVDGSSAYGSFIRNLKLTQEILGVDNCSALLTITKDNIKDLRSIIDHYVELGFKSIFLRALNPYGNAVINYKDLGYTINEFITAYKDALDYIIQLNIKGTNFVESYTTLLLSRILTPFSTGFVDLQSPSGAGISGAIYYYNGEVYPADEARMLARMGDRKFYIGHVLKDKYKDIFNGSVIRDIVYNSCVENMPICADCAYQQYCGADPIRNYLETKDIVGNRLCSDFCYKNENILDYLFKLIIENNPDVMSVFWSWITKRTLEEVKIENN